MRLQQEHVVRHRRFSFVLKEKFPQFPLELREFHSAPLGRTQVDVAEVGRRQVAQSGECGTTDPGLESCVDPLGEHGVVHARILLEL